MTTEERLLELLILERQQLAEDRRAFERDKERFERWLSFMVDRVTIPNHQSNSNGSSNNGGVMRCTGRQSFGRLIDGKPTILWENEESKAERAING